MSAQTYYVPEQSRFPIFMAVSLFLLVMGASSTINNLDNPDSNSSYILYAGFASLFTTMFFVRSLASMERSFNQMMQKSW